MGKRVSTRLGIDLREAKPSVEFEEIRKARAFAEQGGAIVQRISDGYRVIWADGKVDDFLDPEINNLVDALYSSYSDTWGADLRRAGQSEQSEALRTVREQCERVGLTFRHRAKGWSVTYADRVKNYWPEEINELVDEVEAYAMAKLAVSS